MSSPLLLRPSALALLPDAAPLLATVNLSDPVLWAVLIGWVMSVVLHELAHGVVAYLGGDYTIRERGGLTLNPLQYIHPVNSILLPAVFLLMGGVPLPGGATYVRRDLLRTRAWETGVSLAGPASNFVLFALLVLPLHPALGLMTLPRDGHDWTSLQQFIATLGTLQFLAGVINLIPIPPLDGFGAVSPYLPPELRAKLQTPQAALTGMLVTFFVVLNIPSAFQRMFYAEDRLLVWMGMRHVVHGLTGAYNGVMFGQ